MKKEDDILGKDKSKLFAINDGVDEDPNQVTSDNIVDGQFHQHTTSRSVYRRKKPTDSKGHDEIVPENTVIDVEEKEEEKEEEREIGNRIWSSMTSALSCFHSAYFDYRISQGPTSIASESEPFYAKKVVYRRNGELVSLISANESVYYRFPDEVFGNHSSEMFFWPFLIPWKVMIMSILMINFEIICYNVFFDWRYLYVPVVNSYSRYMAFWVMQMIFLIDIMLTIVHKQWKEFEIKHTITPRHRVYITVDLLIMLPTFLCSYLFDKEKFFPHTIEILAFHRIIMYTKEMTRVMNVSRGLVLFITFLYVWMFNIALCTFAFGYSCLPNEKEKNWLCGKDYWYKSYIEMEYMEKPRTEVELYALSKLHALYLLPPLCEAEYFNNAGAVIRWMYIIMLIFIVLFSYLYVVPLLSKRIFKNDYLWISFSLMRYKVINSLSEMKFADISPQKVDQFFSYAWRKRKSLLVESVAYDIPPELWQSVHQDIFYPALAHSLLFADEDESYLRMLASRMHSVLLMEGDILLRKKALAARMVYVVEGSIQILTTEDDTTPQLVLGAGSCIGETTLISSYNSNCYICCHSMTAEIHVLEKFDFIEISSRFKRHFNLAVSRVKERYKKAKTLHRQNEVIQMKVKKSLRLEEQLITSNDWLKFKMQIFSDSKTNLKSEDYTFSGLEDWYIHANHTIAFLDQLAVPQIGNEGMADPVLLKLTFPFIFQPESRVHQVWDKIIFLSVCFLAAYLPYSFSFSCDYTPFMQYNPLIYLIIYFLDLLLQISTSIQTRRGMLVNTSEIAYRLLQQPVFIVDLISTLPLFLFSYVILDRHKNVRSVLQLNQLLKIYRIEQFLEQKWSIQTEYQFYWHRLIKYVVYFSYLLYFSTCLLFGVICANNSICLTRQVFIIHEYEVYKELSPTKLLVLGLYKTSSYFFGTLSLSVMQDVGMNELIPYAIIRFMSYFLCVYILSSLISIKAFTKGEYFKFNENVKSLLMMTKATDMQEFENSSEYRLYKYTCLLKHDVFLSGMPSSLGMILKSNVFMKVIMEHPIFVEMPRELVMRLANHFQLLTIPARHVMIKQKHPPKFMFFITKGVLRAIEDGEHVKNRLRPGEGFGVVEACLGIPYKRTIISETDAEVIVLESEKFKRYLSNNYHGTESISNVIKTFKFFIEQENKERSDINLPVREFLRETSVDHGNMHVHEPSVVDSSVTKNVPNFFRRMLNVFKTQSTFHPHSSFVYKLEISHAALAIAAFVFYPLQPVLVNCLMPELKIINFVLIGLGVIHIYLQSCIGYYHPTTGILITRRDKAVKNYLKNSMCLDIFSTIPFDLIPITDFQLLQLLLTYNHLLQIYRFAKGMNYLEKKYRKYQVILTFTHFIVMLCLIVNALSSLILVSSCEIKEGINQDNPLFSKCLKCYPDTLITTVAVSVKWGGRPLFIGSAEAYLYSAYFAITTIMCNALQNLIAHNPTEVILSAIGPVFGLFVFFLYTSVFVNTVLDINHAEYQFSIKVERLLQFYKSWNVPDDITRITKSYLSSLWHFNRGLNLNNILKPVNSISRTEIFFQVFIGNLLRNKILDEKAPYMFFDKLFDHMSIRYYSHKCNIILSGDVLSEVFFISKGFVHIFDSQNNFIGTVGPGSIFGALGQEQWSHQRFSFVAVSIVEVLVISSMNLHRKVLQNLPQLKRNFTVENRFNLLVEVTQKQDVEVDQKPVKNDAKKEKRGRYHVPPRISSHLHDFNVSGFTTPSQKFLKIWAEVLIFLCTMSCSLTVYCLATHDNSSLFHMIYYSTDFLKIITIFFRQKKLSRRSQSNLPIVRNRNISILFDILISFPIDAIFFAIDNENFLTSLLKINRLFSLLYIRYHWFKTCKRSMKDILPNDYSKVFYFVVLIHFAVFCIIGISSLLYVSWIAQEQYKNDDDVFKQTNFLTCVAFVINIHLPFRIRKVSLFPKTLTMISINIIHKLLSPFVVAVYLGYVFVCICRSRFIYPHLLRRSFTFLRFMRNQRVANRFQFKVQSTFENNWFKFKDSPVPELFSALPNHLQAAVKNHAFGKYIERDFVFEGCDPDFLRQVVACVKILWLQPGDKIVKLYSRNGCMYFVVEGIVLMNNVTNYTVNVLESGSSFGMAQGIDPKVGHAFNFIAHSNCCIVYLNFNDWSHLAKFYPESMKRVRERIDEVNVRLEDEFGLIRY